MGAVAIARLVEESCPRSRPVEVDDREYLEPDVGLLGASPGHARAKRTLDVVGALVLLVLLAPLMLVVAGLVRLTSSGPVLYSQERIGRGGESFRFFKFRTMIPDADKVRTDLLERNEAAGPVFKMRRDPRITPVGRVLRKLSIDELPQLFSVLDGTMSLVGPRPPLPEEVAAYTTWEQQRLLVNPGLTCIWQVSGRSDIGFERWVAMDLAYIRSWNIGLDLQILLRTLPAVLTGRGAY